MGALTGLFAVVCVVVGVLVWPAPKEAKAQNIGAWFNSDWNGQNAFHCHASAELLDGDGDPYFPPVVIQLAHDDKYEIWTGWFLNAPADAAYMRTTWDGGAYVWTEFTQNGQQVNGSMDVDVDLMTTNVAFAH